MTHNGDRPIPAVAGHARVTLGANRYDGACDRPGLEPVTPASTWGSSTIRVIFVVITDRASPRPTISSFHSLRRVAGSPHSQNRGEEPLYWLVRESMVTGQGEAIRRSRI
jgi:hypothetical protein